MRFKNRMVLTQGLGFIVLPVIAGKQSAAPAAAAAWLVVVVWFTLIFCV
jgi:hypothetical protein